MLYQLVMELASLNYHWGRIQTLHGIDDSRSHTAASLVLNKQLEVQEAIEKFFTVTEMA